MIGLRHTASRHYCARLITRRLALVASNDPSRMRVYMLNKTLNNDIVSTLQIIIVKGNTMRSLSTTKPFSFNGVIYSLPRNFDKQNLA